jgi:protein-S-isoprenylcysteine O-methyltransferase Ste14
MSQAPNFPSSASYVGINFIGGMFYLAVLIAGMAWSGFGANVVSLLGMFAAVGVILLLEISVLKVHRRPGAFRAETQQGFNWPRITVKLVAFFSTIVTVSFFYALLPTVFNSARVSGMWNAIELLIVPYSLLGTAYICWYDRHMVEPHDSLWKFGAMIVGKKGWDRKSLLEYLRSILLRSFFAPMMLSGLIFYTTMITGQGIDVFIQKEVPLIDEVSFKELIKVLLIVYLFFSSIDVLFAAIGYLFPMKAIDADIKSTETSWIGWAVCLACYDPFFTAVWMLGAYGDLFHNPEWYVWFSEYPLVLGVWGIAAVLANILEASTTMTFGMRFSNLGYRGLITSGAFRFTKHPQYVAKAINRFMMYVPLLSLGGVSGVASNMAGFAFFALIYYLRARTEEIYLTRNHPEYVVYAKLMNERSVFRGFAKLLPFLKYSEDRIRAGKLF